MFYSYKDVLKDIALDLVGCFEVLLYFVYNFGGGGGGGGGAAGAEGSHINICASY